MTMTMLPIRVRVRIRQRTAKVATRHWFSTNNSNNSNTRLFFEWLEQNYGARFGGKPLPMDSNSDNNNNQMITTNTLTYENLRQLLNHEISVLKVKQFFPKQQSIALGRQLSQQLSTAKNWKVSTSRGLESSDVVTIGKHAPYNIAKTDQAENEYFENVRLELRDRRKNSNNDSNNSNTNSNTNYTLHPLDLLRLELDELFPSGAGLARKNHETTHKDCMGGGLPRLMVGPTRWKKGLVHVDELAPLTENNGCFSANVYLQLPYKNDENATSTSTSTSHENGEDINMKDEQPVMEVWPLGIRSKWDWYRVSSLFSTV